MGFECNITIHNKTSGYFLLNDSSVKHGEYPWGSPPNTIPSGTTAQLVLDTKFGDVNGTDGQCSYELYHPDNPNDSSSLDLAYIDPTVWLSKNTCIVKTNSNRLTCDLHFNDTGSPMNANLDVSEKGANVVAMVVAAEPTSTTPKLKAQVAAEEQLAQGIESAKTTLAQLFQAGTVPTVAMYKIGFNETIAGHRVQLFPPVHETIAIAAFVQSSLPRYIFPKGTTYNNLNAEQWENIRGVLWNDDPQCLLFKNNSSSSHDFDDGVAYAAAFNDPFHEHTLTHRSHFEDLQFLHSMAPKAGDTAQSVKDALMQWLEVMYKLACGNQGIQPTDTLSSVFGGIYFTNPTTPTGGDTLRDLLLGHTTSYAEADIQKRALGVCLHIISDSYAVGHTKRKILNTDDLDKNNSGGYIAFKSGTYGRFGDILTFHTYAGQDDTRHGHYDKLPGALPKANDLTTFDSIIGARDAIEKSTRLINFWNSKTSWDSGVKSFLGDEVFKLDANVTVGDTSVDS